MKTTKPGDVVEDYIGSQAGTPEGMVSIFEWRLESSRELPRKGSGYKPFQAEKREHKGPKARMSLRGEGQCGWNTARGKCVGGG